MYSVDSFNFHFHIDCAYRAKELGCDTVKQIRFAYLILILYNIVENYAVGYI